MGIAEMEEDREEEEDDEEEEVVGADVVHVVSGSGSITSRALY